MELLDNPVAELAFLDRYDAFTDNPVPFLFEVLDRRFPGARFVLTTRPVDDWLRSMEWLFEEGLDRLDAPTRALGNRVHDRLYGITAFDADVLGRVYTSHHASVGRHFESRPDDLLTVPVDELGWSRFCEFLDVEEPSTSFPHENASRSDHRHGVVSRLRRDRQRPPRD